jgi:hypothetical protein
MKIRRDIHNFVFIVGVVDNGDKLFTVVYDTGDELLPVSLLPAINHCRCPLTPVIKPFPGFSSIP